MKAQTVLDTLEKFAARALLEPELAAGGRFASEAERRAYLDALADVRAAIAFAAVPRPLRHMLGREAAAQRAGEPGAIPEN